MRGGGVAPSQYGHRLGSAVRRAAAVLLGLSVGLPAAQAQQSGLPRPERLPEFGRTLAGTDDATSTATSPANLAFVPGAEMRWSSVYLQEELSVPWQGHAVSLSTRLPFNLATGLRLDFVNPPRGVGLVAEPTYQWLTWGLAVRSGPQSAFGLSVQGSFSDGAYADDLLSFSLGYTTRPFNAVGLSLLARDVNAPDNGFYRLSRSYQGGLAVRPLGGREVELGLELGYEENSELWTPKAVLGIDVPYVGRLRGDFSMTDPTSAQNRAWLASAGLAVYTNQMDGSFDVNAGVVTGDALGSEDSFNPYVGAAVRNFREPVGLDTERYAVRIRVEETPNSRVHVAFLRQLWSLAKEPLVDAVVFELRSAPADSLAYIQELRDAVFELRRAGKRTLCHLEDAGGAAMYFCAAANQTFINPAGGLRFSGMRSQHLYFARLLDKLGVRADFIRSGEHKSAPEQFTRTGSTDVSRADKIDLLQQYERHFVDGLAAGRNLAVEQVRERMSRGPFVSREAVEEGLLDGVSFDDEVEKKLQALTGRKTPLRWDVRRPVAPGTFGAGGVVALVYVDGDMIDGRSRSIPFLGMEVSGSYTIADTLKAVRENPQVKAVVVRVNSPGGSSVAAEVMWRQLKLTAEKKPTVVSMGSVAASGGYYLAMGATRVFASPLTVTGSIGVFYGKADVSELLNRIGVDVETYRTSPRADAESLFRPFSEDERAVLEQKVQLWYRDFLQRVADGRKMSPEAVHEVAQGRVWTGEQAHARGLVDELGGLRQALAYARQQAGLPDDCAIIELPIVEQPLLARLLGLGGFAGLSMSLLDAPMPKGLTQTLRALGPFVIHDEEAPLMRMEYGLPVP